MGKSRIAAIDVGFPCPFLASCLGQTNQMGHQGKEADPWNLPLHLSDLLQHFASVFTTPTFQTFLQIATGWALSLHRHRYVTEVIFAGGNVGNGYWLPISIASSAMPPGTWTSLALSLAESGRYHSGSRFRLVFGGRRRYPLPQTRTDSRRCRNALRSADL